MSRRHVTNRYTLVKLANLCSMVQNRAQATQHYTAKVDYIRTNLETLQDTIQKKQDNLNYLVNVMQMKLQAQATAKESK